MFQKFLKRIQEQFEIFANIGFALSFVGVILLIGATLATLTYNYVNLYPYGQYLAFAVFLFFTTIVFAVFKIIASETRRRNIWDELEKKVSPDTTNNQTDYLLRRVTFSVKEFTDSTRWLFRSVRLYKYSSVGLSVISTIVLGLNFNYLTEENRILYSIASKNIALVLNTLITAISTLSLFWNIEKYWIQNKVIKHQLKRLKADIEYQMSRIPSKQIEDSTILSNLFNRHQAILGDFHLYWEGVLTEKKDGK